MLPLQARYWRGPCCCRCQRGPALGRGRGIGGPSPGRLRPRTRSVPVGNVLLHEFCKDFAQLGIRAVTYAIFVVDKLPKLPKVRTELAVPTIQLAHLLELPGPVLARVREAATSCKAPQLLNAQVPTPLFVEFTEKRLDQLRPGLLLSRQWRHGQNRCTLCRLRP